MGLADPPPHLIAAGQTDPGQRRGLNEDAWRIADESDLGDMIEERGQLFAVADGMGGHAAGEVASELAIETLFAEYYGGDGFVGTLFGAAAAPPPAPPLRATRASIILPLLLPARLAGKGLCQSKTLPHSEAYPIPFAASGFCPPASPA